MTGVQTCALPIFGSGLALFNISVENTNGTVWLDIDGSNYTGTNLTLIVYNSSVTLTNGTYNYQWWAYGNGTDNNLNGSEIKSYTVNPNVIDIEYPIFTNLDDNNGTLINSGDIIINSTITSTNGSSGIEFDSINYTSEDRKSVV